MEEITSRSRILDATAVLLRTRGLRGTTLSAVANRAGMLAPSLYHHFDSKDQLVEEVLVEGCHRNTRYIVTNVEVLGAKASPVERLEAAITAHLTFLLTGDEYSSAVSRVFQDLPDEMKRRVLAAYAGFDNYWRDLILAARQSGAARVDLDPTVARKFLVNMLDSAAEWYRPGHLEIPEIARQACRLFLRGFVDPAAEQKSEEALGRTALVTGGGSGIGRAAALALAADGWSVTICGRRREALDQTAALADGIRAIECDLADPDAIARLFADVRETEGRLDLLFNNAGIFPNASAIETIDLADWQRSLNINLTGYFLATQHALRLMKAQSPAGGRIINNGSVSAHTPRPHAAAYTVAKHGVAGLTKATALEGRAFGIACGQIDIGNAASDMTASFGAGLLQGDGSTRPEPVFDVMLAGQAVAHMASLPLDANILFMTLAATGMPLVGRG